MATPVRLMALEIIILLGTGCKQPQITSSHFPNTITRGSMEHATSIFGIIGVAEMSDVILINLLQPIPIRKGKPRARKVIRLAWW